MPKLTIAKSEKTLKKEENKNKIETLKAKKNVTNEELKDLLILVLEKSHGGEYE